MPRATLTTKGQITLPKEVRDQLEVEFGDQLDFIVRPNGDVLLRPAKYDLLQLEGILRKKAQRHISIEEMNDTIRNRMKKMK